MESIIIHLKEDCQRIDKLLTHYYPNYSRTYFQELIEEGLVLLNGALIKKRVIPEVNDEIEVCFRIVPEMTLAPEPIPLSILYEDDHLIAINKPAGMVVHPAPGHWTQTLVSALLYHCKNLPPGSTPLRPGIVHRLDKDTSGVLVAAKTTLCHQKLVEMFALREMKKIYFAICVGRPPNITLTTKIARHPTHRQKMAVSKDGGKEAISQIEVISYKEDLSLVRIAPLTGRTHQIRVHLQHLGAPVLGDNVYGSDSANRRYSVARQLLHASELTMIHPITGEPLTLTAPLPDDFVQIYRT